jgi:FkbM family methyltransferase
MALYDSVRREFGVARSLYLRVRYRNGRWRDPLLAQFVGPGELVFDIGAHVGDCIASLRRLQAQVVAVEPQPALMRVLRLLHGRDQAVMLEPAAVADQAGALALYLNLSNPTVSSASQPFIGAAQGASGWQGQRWERPIEVRTTTLDALIARYGEPVFCKIDVEGFELQVLRGLSRPLRALSFEFTTIQRQIAQQAAQTCEQLGRYRYNASLGDSGVLEHAVWLDAAGIQAWLEQLPHLANAGDVYAVREAI